MLCVYCSGVRLQHEHFRQEQQLHRPDGLSGAAVRAVRQPRASWEQIHDGQASRQQDQGESRGSEDEGHRLLRIFDLMKPIYNIL